MEQAEADLYELVIDAVRQALRDEAGGGDAALTRRMVGGHVAFRDAEGRTIKEIDAHTLFRKITAIRERLRVLEQKLNNHAKLDDGDKAELQGYLTRCYGSLTTFNFLFRDDADKFKGTRS
ncbi:MAG TPA: hypothetical protein ENK18_20315 [Deltaproteobacteria bacterium]|nr:hypothetical protein [Deltaproteobacteria bacterium]